MKMYAVIRTGGKQYRVAPGAILEVERIAGVVGDSVVLDDVLMVAGDDDVRIGQPNVDGASVTAKITGQHRGEKILVLRYRPKKRVRVHRGHRQNLTRLQIHKISGEGFEFVEETQQEAAPEPVASVAEAVAEEAEPVVEVGEAGAPVAVVAATDSVIEADDTTETGTEEEADAADKAVAMLKDTVAKADDVLDDTVAKAGDVLGETVDKAGDVLDDVADSIRALPFVGRGKTTGEEESASDNSDAESEEKKEE
jgi:large subunit ribosomal protein L21